MAYTMPTEVFLCKNVTEIMFVFQTDHLKCFLCLNLQAYELSTLTGTQVMLLVASETGHVYTFATRKLQPMITSESGKALIQTCLNSPDPPPMAPGQQQAVEQRMNPGGFEETELTYAVEEENGKVKSNFRQEILESEVLAKTSQ